MKTANATLLTVPEMGRIVGLFERVWEMGDVIELTTINPDGSRNRYDVLVDDANPKGCKAAFWCLFNDGNYQRSRTVPAAFTS